MLRLLRPILTNKVSTPAKVTQSTRNFSRGHNPCNADPSTLLFNNKLREKITKAPFWKIEPSTTTPNAKPGDDLPKAMTPALKAESSDKEKRDREHLDWISSNTRFGR